MSKIIGIDLGTTNSCVAIDIRIASRYHQRRRYENNTICCGIHKDRRKSCR